MTSVISRNRRVILLLVLTGVAASGPAAGHGSAGKRFFPATLVIDDPFVADELSLPTVSYSKQPASGDEPATRETDFSIDVSKRITENFGVGLGALYKQLQPEGGDRQRGFDNIAASLKYQFYKNDEHEAILSAGLDVDIGGTGSKRVGADSFSTFTPALFFGKGFGDLPAEMKFLRPFAVTGQLGIGIPSSASSSTVNDEGEVSVERHPNILQWGFTLQYSLIYLQSFVEDVGLREPFNRMVPVVEIPSSTALNRGSNGTTGTVIPGIIWAGQYVNWRSRRRYRSTAAAAARSAGSCNCTSTSTTCFRTRSASRFSGIDVPRLPLILLALVVALPMRADAHAFLDHATPAVGSTVHSSPPQVKLWFTQRLEPAFSTAQVFDPSGKRIDKQDAHLDPTDAALLVVTLAPLAPGTYRVTWRVLSVDTHVTEGDFTFDVAP